MHSRVEIHSQMVDRVAALEEYVNGVQGCLSLKEVGIISIWGAVISIQQCGEVEGGILRMGCYGLLWTWAVGAVWAAGC
jgi:hypothetical protein